MVLIMMSLTFSLSYFLSNPYFSIKSYTEVKDLLCPTAMLFSDVLNTKF